MNDSCVWITLDLQKGSMPFAVQAKRGDTGRKLLISLSDNGVPYIISEDCTAVFTARKESGAKFREDCVTSGNTIAYTFSEQVCVTVGTVTAEIKLYSGDGRLLTSAAFQILIRDAVFNEGDEIVTEEYVQEFSQLVEDTRALKAELEEKLADGSFVGPQGPPGEPGQNGADGTVSFAELTEEQRASLTGPQGEPGADGKSAYSCAVDGGYEGTEEDFANQLAREWAAPEYVDTQIASRLIHSGGRNLFDINQVIPSNVTNTAVTISGDSIRVWSTAASGTYHATKGNVFTVKANVTYTLSVVIERIVSGTISYGFRSGPGNSNHNENKILSRRTIAEAGSYSFTYTPTEDLAVYASFFITDSTAGETGDATFAKIMVEEGSPATDYEPYYKGLAELTALWTELDAAYQEGVDSV